MARKAVINHLWIGNQKQELVDAINKVLFTQFKKDAKEAHELVESYGFEIEKYDGYFGIYNPDTNRHLKLDEPYGNHSVYIKYGRKLSNDEWHNQKLNFDVINYLYMPHNFEYSYIRNRSNGWYDKPTKNKYYGLECAKSDVRHKDKEIESLKAQLVKVQEELIKAVEEKASITIRIEELRQELGLKKGA